jgi:hypothetical protein
MPGVQVWALTAARKQAIEHLMDLVAYFSRSRETGSSQKRPFFIPHFVLPLNFSAPVAIIGNCAKVCLVADGVVEFH